MLQTTGPLPALVLLACGTTPQISGLQAAAAPPLAKALQLQLGPALPAGPAPQAQASLAALPCGVLAPLTQDPGLALADGGHWAERLGAWRQPCLLLIRGEQLDSGVAAATTALLRQWQVPLLGLVQWQGPWTPQARLADQLPWLGWLDECGQGADALALAARQRARLLHNQLV